MHAICITRGTQFPDNATHRPPVPSARTSAKCQLNGQQWTTLDPGQPSQRPARGRARDDGIATGRFLPSASVRCWCRRRPATCCGTASA